MSLVVEQATPDASKVVLGWGYQAARLFDHGSALTSAMLEPRLAFGQVTLEPAQRRLLEFR